jgi:predicted nucleic-acid-binding protein
MLSECRVKEWPKLLKVITSSNVMFEHPDAITRALDLYRAGFDFADAVHLVLADRAPVAGFATFDRDFARRANMDFPGLKVAAPQDFAA